MLMELYNSNTCVIPTDEEVYDMVCIKKPPCGFSHYLEKVDIPQDKYSLVLTSGLRSIFEKTGIYSDESYKFSLKSADFNFSEIACICFNRNEYVFEIGQIQAVGNRFGQIPNNFKMSDIIPKQWERKMLKMTVEFARDAGYRRITSKRAESLMNYENPFFIGPSELGKHQERLRMRYNVTPPRVGFGFDGDKYFIDFSSRDGK